MKYKFLLLTLWLTFISISSPQAAAPDVTADAAVIMDAGDGRFLYAKNGTKREYPASMTKMMTCLLAIEKGDPYKTVTVSRKAANVVSTALNGGEWLSLGDLENQMMMISDNGAATAIAENVAGSLPAFADMMNEKAEEIGMKGTHFVNANGMPDEDHYSTAEDMARLARYAMENKTFPAPQASRPAIPAPQAAAWLPPPSGIIMSLSSLSCTPGIWTAGLRKRQNFWTMVLN